MSVDLEQRFLEFHRANPHVYDRLWLLALQAVARGRTRVGMKMLWEVLRWQEFLETSGDGSGWRLNNVFTAYYARLLMEREPRLAGVFETRTLRNDRSLAVVAPPVAAPDCDPDTGSLFTFPTAPEEAAA